MADPKKKSVKASGKQKKAAIRATRAAKQVKKNGDFLKNI
ncbi:hypothetical protein GCM10023075_33170 [Streptosporangium album]